MHYLNGTAPSIAWLALLFMFVAGIFIASHEMKRHTWEPGEQFLSAMAISVLLIAGTLYSIDPYFSKATFWADLHAGFETLDKAQVTLMRACVAGFIGDLVLLVGIFIGYQWLKLHRYVQQRNGLLPH